jgi:hypothetical protein
VAENELLVRNCETMISRKCTVVLIMYRPKEFAKKSTYPEDSEEEESTVGKMPPTDSDED